MKKILSLLLGVVLVSVLCVTAFAAETGSFACDTADKAIPSEEVTFVYSIKDVAAFNSFGIEFEYDKNTFDLVSGKWLIEGAPIAQFIAADNRAALAFASEQTVSGNVFELVLKVKEDAVVDGETTKISADAIIKTPAAVVFEGTVSKSLKVICNEHTFGDWIVTKEANCDTKGEEARTCSVCDEVETREVKALGHKYSDPTVTKEATCTEDGSEVSKCTVCDKEKTSKIEAKGHSFGDAVVTKPATVTETGLKKSTCSVCGEVKEEEIPCLTADPNAPGDNDTSSESKPSTDKDNDTVGGTNNDIGDGEEENNNTLWIIILIIIILVVAGIIVIYFIKKKNSSFDD